MYRADLHIHTSLSPCASFEMTPRAIVRAALERGLGIIAICDHNTADAAGLVEKTAAGRLYVMPGMEITTAEEVHVTALFPDRNSALTAGSKVKNSLCVRKKTGVLNDVYASSATTMSLAECVKTIKAHGGIAVAAHADRPSFSVFSQLGFIPEDAGFDAIEITAASSGPRGLFVTGLPIVASSDSHCLWDVGTIFTVFELKKPVWEEVFLALKSGGKRRFWVA